MSYNLKLTLAALAAATALSAGAAKAQEPTACDSVSFSDVGWTDITTTTATAKHLLEGLGYKVDVKVLSVPVTFASLKSDDVDVFLGNWMPTMEGDIAPYREDGSVETVRGDERRSVETGARLRYTFLYATAPKPIFREVLAFV